MNEVSTIQQLLTVSLRQRAVYLPRVRPTDDITPQTALLVRQWRELGWAPDEPLLRALNGLTDEERQALIGAMNDVMGTKLNWAAMVRQWDVPTGTSWLTHLQAWMANVFDTGGVRLSCGHIIPDGTFPLERYNGCPLCGRPFTTADFTLLGQNVKLKVLQLWGDNELTDHLRALIASPVPLDATQRQSLTTLLQWCPLPADVQPAMKETLMLVVKTLTDNHRADEAGRLLTSPTDILRLLWYEKTGQTQIVEPRTLLRNKQQAYAGCYRQQDEAAQHVADYRAQLRLHYSRPECVVVARWLNAMPLTVDAMCEQMHPKRRMWIRFIRALRLTEYARRPGFDHLRQLLDRFYHQQYPVWAARLERARNDGDAAQTLQLLSLRPGLFARCLFSTMLRFGFEPVLEAFRHVMSQLPRRLLVSLATTADTYFDPALVRIVRPLGGSSLELKPHPLLRRYTVEQRQAMVDAVNGLYVDEMRRHYAAQAAHTAPHTLYIDPRLADVPVSVGDRATTVQDASAALQGTRFQVEGDRVRLFLHWGAGLPAQYLDMDLSCAILRGDEVVSCAYFNQTVEGAQHSGDFQEIPDQVGTAEYIELNLPVLQRSGAELVVFTCNAYSGGNVAPNMRVGWMSCEHPMQIDAKTGVAYDPSTVQHSVRISSSELSKGLIFGVLDVSRREITWLEMPFSSQTVLAVNAATVRAYLDRLRRKPTISQLLRLKAEAQQLQIVDSADEAAEAYTYEWALDAAKVAAELL